MAYFNSYFSSCVLLLLVTLSWRTSTGAPVTTPMAAEKCGGDCCLRFKELLLNITELLSSDVLWHGINSDQMAIREVRSAETPLACAPTLTQNCMERNSPFNESECLSNIMKDIAHFGAAIQSYLESPLRLPEEENKLLSPILEIIQFLKNCSLMPKGENDSSEENTAQMWGNNSYDNRLEMHKMMRGFYVRTITINRAMGYIYQ
ncbi:interleukin-12 subunit alpha [Sebastes umbrosus]|uniref:interleukin-12 subunit alpha n=1 Tax=Sebastes umbrosus TaxID=72105 RepID=UPI00189FBB14|nr:interleukin-12 subunit alpha [Sebastes umbrosus]